MNPSAPRILAVGELLWDLLPDGRQLGGAPSNFGCNARALGAEARILSRVGADALGREILERLRGMHMPVDLISVDPDRPTGTVSVEVSPDGQPRFTIHEQVAWDNIPSDPAALKAASSADVVCFGTLAQRAEPSRSSLTRLVAAAPEKALRILDINLRQHFHSPGVIQHSLELANVLKLNDGELPVLAALFELRGSPRDQLMRLADRFGLGCIALTRGGQGSLLMSQGEFSEHPGIPTDVVDTVGAGDSFTAALALGLLAGWPLAAIHHHASEVAAFVCSRRGATPELPQRLRDPFVTSPTGRTPE